MELLRVSKLKTTVSSEDGFCFLLFLIWTRTVVVSYVYQTLLLIPFVSELADIIKVSIYIIAILLAIPYMLRRLRLSDLLLYVIFCVVFYFAYSNSSNTSQYLSNNAVNILLIAVPAYFVGVCIDSDDYIDMLHSWSQICIFLTFVHLLVFGYVAEAGTTSNMGQAYRILQHLVLVILYMFKYKRITDIVLGLIGTLMLFGCGNRGSILALVVFVILFFLINSSNFKRILVLLGLLIATFFIYFNLNAIMGIMEYFFSKFGFSTRIIEMIQYSMLSSDNGRNDITQLMFTYIQQKPYLGYGMAGDRLLTLTGGYSHNFFIELWISYGLIFGSIIAFFVIWLCIKSLIIGNNEQKMFILAFIFGGGLFKLLFTSSYLIEFQFFMLIGYCICLIREYKFQRRFGENYE